MFPLPYNNALKYRTRETVGGISFLGFSTKCTAVCRPLFAACGTPDQGNAAQEQSIARTLLALMINSL
jgi:hypothetical protein